MRAPILAIAVAGGLVLGGTAAAVAVTAPTSPPTTTQTPSPGDPVDGMGRMHEQMLRDDPEMGRMHDRMLTEHPEMRGIHQRMMGGS